MSESCPPIEKLERIAGLPPSDPEREHFDDCPRCKARWRSLQLFLDPGAPPAGADLRDAAARLSLSVRKEAGIEASSGDASGPAGATATATATPSPKPPGWLARLFLPPFRPAIAIGAALVVLGVFLQLAGESPLQPRSSGPSSTLRGTEERALAAPRGERLPDGSVVLRWERVEGADSYRILLYGSSLAETAWPEATGDTTLILPAGTLEELAGPGTPSGSVFCRVAAIAAGDLLRVSAPALLPGP